MWNVVAVASRLNPEARSSPDRVALLLCPLLKLVLKNSLMVYRKPGPSAGAGGLNTRLLTGLTNTLEDTLDRRLDDP